MIQGRAKVLEQEWAQVNKDKYYSRITILTNLLA
jgi:hypothetical protein